MTPLTLLLVCGAEALAVLGQLLFKVAMGPRWEANRRRAWLILGGGIGAMAINFFVWLGLLEKYDLSFLYPFDGLNRIFLLVASGFFLKEKLTLNLWLGVVLISSGIYLVATS